MEPLHRVIRYIDFGFSAERLAEIMDWPVDKVRAVKGVPLQKAKFKRETKTEELRPA